MTPVLAATGLAFGPPGRTLMAIPALAVAPGSMVALLGPNGVGKSTLLRTLAGLAPPHAGRIDVAGRPLAAWPPRELARVRAFVASGRVDVPDGTVAEHVALGRHPHTAWLGGLGPADHEACARALALVGIAALADRALETLSDGERQKAALARALAQEPRLLLLDEPTAFLDARGRADVTWLLRDLARRVGLAVVFSTHDLRLAATAADWLWTLDPARGWRDGPALELALAGAFAARPGDDADGWP